MSLPDPPVRGFSFTSFSTNNPTAQQPGGNLDAEIDRTNGAFTSLLNTIKVSVNADGTLNSTQVGQAYQAFLSGGGATQDSGDISEASSQDFAGTSQAWAEYMPDELPAATLAVMGITGQHWSARWWANQAAINVETQQRKLVEALAAAQLNQNAPDLPGGPITSLVNLTLVGGALTALPPAPGTVVTSVAGRGGDVLLSASDIPNFNASASAAAPVQSVAGRTGAVILAAADVAGAAPLASPALTGTPTAPTQITTDNTTTIATTAFVARAITNAAVTFAPLASPGLTGTPTTPTAASTTNNTQIASTAFVKTAVAAEAVSRNNADLLKAPLASPSFPAGITVAGVTAAQGGISIGTTANTSITADTSFFDITLIAGTSWSLQFNKATGALTFFNSAASSLFSCNGQGDVDVARSLTTRGGLTMTAGGYQLGSGGASPFSPVSLAYGVLANGSNMIASSFYAISDERMKLDVHTIEDDAALAWLKLSHPVTYRKLPNPGDDPTTAIPEAGFIAQEQVLAGFGDYVARAPAFGLQGNLHDPDGLYPQDVSLSLPSSYQIAHLTRAVQILLGQIEDLNERVHHLETRGAH